MSINELRSKIEQLEEALNLPGSEDAKASIRMGIDAAKKKLKQMEDEEDGGKDDEKDKGKDKKNRNKREPRSRTKKGKKGSKGNISVDCDELLKRYRKSKLSQKKRIKKRKEKGLPPEKTLGEKVKSLSKSVAKTSTSMDEKGRKFSSSDEKSIKSSVFETIESFLKSTASQERKISFLNYIEKKIASLKKHKFEEGGFFDVKEEFLPGDLITNKKTGDEFEIIRFEPSFYKNDFLVEMENVETGGRRKFMFPAQKNLFEHSKK